MALEGSGLRPPGLRSLSTRIGPRLTWETADDWDAASDELGVLHEDPPGHPTGSAGEVVLGSDEDNNDLSRWTLGGTDAEVPSTFAPSTDHDRIGDYVISVQTTGTATTYDQVRYDYGSVRDISTVSYWCYLPNPANGNWIHRANFYNGNDEIMMANSFDGAETGDVACLDGTSGWNLVYSNYPANTWMEWRYDFDWANDQLVIYKDGEQVYSGGLQTGGDGLRWFEMTWDHDEGGISAYHDHFNAIFADSGHLETATKSFSVQREPDLADLSYSLGGESMDVAVIGSPGTASEETVTQTLDGAQDYALTWTNSHADFRVRPELGSADAAVSPYISSISLVG